MEPARIATAATARVELRYGSLFRGNRYLKTPPRTSVARVEKRKEIVKVKPGNGIVNHQNR